MFSNFKNSVIYAQEKTKQSLKKEIATFGSLRETTICHFFKRLLREVNSACSYVLIKASKQFLNYSALFL